MMHGSRVFEMRQTLPRPSVSRMLRGTVPPHFQDHRAGPSQTRDAYSQGCTARCRRCFREPRSDSENFRPHSHWELRHFPERTTRGSVMRAREQRIGMIGQSQAHRHSGPRRHEEVSGGPGLYLPGPLNSKYLLSYSTPANVQIAQSPDSPPREPCAAATAPRFMIPRTYLSMSPVLFSKCRRTC